MAAPAARADDQPGQPAAAGSGTQAAANGPKTGADPKGAAAPAWAGDLGTRANLGGGLGGLRPLFDRYGLSFGLSETTEVLGNPNGGQRQGAIVEGVTQMGLGLDLGKALGVDGGLFNISAFQIHGRGLTVRNLAGLNEISSIEGDPSTRLNELWYQQSLWGGRLDIKIGQQSADNEFITSEYEDLFINSGFGWPTLPALDMPSGGPAYPLPTPAIRLRMRPNDSVTLLAAVFNGSPAGLRPGDPQVNDASGTNFDVSSGATLIGEAQLATNHGKDAGGLPGTYKLGGWYNTNRFADAFFLNGPTVQPPGVLVGIPRAFHGDWSLYATADQLVWRPPGDSDGGVALTARAMGAPADRNLVDVFVQGGITDKGVFGRAGDTVGLGIEWAHVGTRAQAGDRAAGGPVRSSETVIEATYQAQVEPWWQLQPDLQYVINPGGGILVEGTTRKAGNAAVLGLRSVVTF